MSQPTTALSAAQLSAAVVPLTVQPELALTQAIRRVDEALLVNDAIRIRLPWLPPPPRQETLGELVQVARRRLRDDRTRTAADELGARRSVLDGVRTRLTP